MSESDSLRNIQVDKTELLRRIERSFQAFDWLLTRVASSDDPENQGVTEVDDEVPSENGGWSVKDVVAHLIAHEQRTIAELRYAKRGEHLRIKHEENDSLNDGAVYACRPMTFEFVRKQWRRSHQLVVEAIQALDEADFDPQSEVVRMLEDSIDGAVANNTYEHYDYHGAQIEAWLDNQPDA